MTQAKGRGARRTERAAILASSEAKYAVDLGQGIFAYEGPPWRLETRDVPRLRELFGDELLAVLARAMAASNRIASLVHLERYNAESFPVDSEVRTRNFYTLVWLTWATMSEAAKLVQELPHVAAERLAGTGCEDSLTALVALARRWSGKSLGKLARDGLVFHFDDKVARKGLAAHKQGDRLAIYTGDSLRVAESWSEFGELVMANGLGATAEELLAFAESNSADQAEFSQHLFRIVNALLHTADVQIDPPPLVDNDEAALKRG